MPFKNRAFAPCAFMLLLGFAINLGGCQGHNERYIPIQTLTAMAGESGRAITTVVNPLLHQKTPTSTATLTPTETSPPSTIFPTVSELSHSSGLYDLRSFTNPNDRLVYVSRRTGNNEIYISSVGGTKLFQLTDNPANDTLPDLSPDGTMVAFVSDRSGDDDIYIINVETKRLTQLTYHNSDDTHPSWSPDGNQIAFVSRRYGNNEISIIDVECASRQRGCTEEVVRITNDVFDDLAPDWSPNGERIAFMSAREGNLEIYHMRPDGSDISRLTQNAGVDGYPSWSPDGTMLTFHAERGGNTDIYVKTLDGLQEWRLTTSPDDDLAPDWHADHIAYMGVSYGDFDIHIIPTADKEPQEASKIFHLGSIYYDGFPSWGRYAGDTLGIPRTVPVPTPHPITITELKSQLTLPNKDRIRDFAWHPDGSLLVVGGREGLYFFDSPTLTLIDIIELDMDQKPIGIDFNPDGTIIAVGHKDKLIRLWDSSSRQVLAIVEGRGNTFSDVIYSPRGDALITSGYDYYIVVWDLVSGQPRRYIYSRHGNVINSIAISPDGNQVAYGAEWSGFLCRFDMDAKSKLKDLWVAESGGGLHAIDYSSDGRFIASGSQRVVSYGRNVEIWDVENEKKIANLDGHNGGVAGVAFSPSSDILASMSMEGRIFLWDTQTWELLLGFYGFGEDLYKLTFAPGGRWLSAASNKTLYFWDIQDRLGLLSD